MNISKAGVIAMAALGFLALYPQKGSAQTFTSKEFLDWPRDSQGFYFRTSIGMAGLIAGQNNEKQGTCIDDWYFRNESEAHDYILGVMETYPSYHPRGVILAILEKRCGELRY